MQLWLWLAAAAPIPPLAWKRPYAAGGALKRKKMSDFNFNFSNFVSICFPGYIGVFSDTITGMIISFRNFKIAYL